MSQEVRIKRVRGQASEDKIYEADFTIETLSYNNRELDKFYILAGQFVFGFESDSRK